MAYKSLIYFCSETPGGRVDVVESTIGCVFVDMWAFCGELAPPPSSPCFFCVVIRYCWLLVVDKKTILLVVGKKVDFVTRRQDQEEEEEEEEEEEDTHLNPLLSARKRQIFLTQGNLASIWRPPWGVSEARFEYFQLSTNTTPRHSTVRHATPHYTTPRQAIFEVLSLLTASDSHR